jgi:CheY-like chemotaxis protein
MPKPILIADDDDLTVTRRILKRAGAKNPILMVNDGDKVIAYLKGEGKFENREKYPIPAILFLDLKIRRIGGFQVLRNGVRLRQGFCGRLAGTLAPPWGVSGTAGRFYANFANWRELLRLTSSLARQRPRRHRRLGRLNGHRRSRR